MSFPLHSVGHLLLLHGRKLFIGPMKGINLERLLFQGLVLKRLLLRLPLMLLLIHGAPTTQQLGLLILLQEENVRDSRDFGSRKSKRQIQRSLLIHLRLLRRRRLCCHHSLQIIHHLEIYMLLLGMGVT